MSTQPFTVMIAGVTKPGMEDYVRNFFLRLIEQAENDDGCMIYNIHESIENPGEFMLYSIWQDETAFEKHNQTPLMQEFKKKLAKDMFDHQSPKTYWKTLSR